MVFVLVLLTIITRLFLARSEQIISRLLYLRRLIARTRVAGLSKARRGKNPLCIEIGDVENRFWPIILGSECVELGRLQGHHGVLNLAVRRRICRGVFSQSTEFELLEGFVMLNLGAELKLNVIKYELLTFLFTRVVHIGTV